MNSGEKVMLAVLLALTATTSITHQLAAKPPPWFQYCLPDSVNNCVGSYKAGSLSNLLYDDNSYYQRYYSAISSETVPYGAISQSWLDTRGTWTNGTNQDIQLDDGRRRASQHEGGYWIISVLTNVTPTDSLFFKVLVLLLSAPPQFQDPTTVDLEARDWTDSGPYPYDVLASCTITPSDVGHFINMYASSTDLARYVNANGQALMRVYMHETWTRYGAWNLVTEQVNAGPGQGYRYRSYAEYHVATTIYWEEILYAKLRIKFDQVVLGYLCDYTSNYAVKVDGVTKWQGTAWHSGLTLGESTITVTDADWVVSVDITFLDYTSSLSPYFTLDQLYVVVAYGLL